MFNTNKQILYRRPVHRRSFRIIHPYLMTLPVMIIFRCDIGYLAVEFVFSTYVLTKTSQAVAIQAFMPQNIFFRIAHQVSEALIYKHIRPFH